MDDSRHLRVFIDGAILKPELGGISTYVAGLTRALGSRPDVRVCIATSAITTLDLGSAVEVVELPASVRQVGRRMIWRERRLAGLVSSWGADVLFAPTVELPLRPLPVRSVMVVHDLGPIERPDLYGRLRSLRFRVGVPLACRRADQVVCVSKATLNALEALFPGRAASCTVIGEAGRRLPFKPRAVRAPPYILVVGSMLPHKNVATLVAAASHPILRDVELILAGPVDERERRRIAAMDRSKIGDAGVKHVGFVDAECLADLYAGAALVALPSLYEGFGLPLLEAMRYGVPAVASLIPAHREVGGDAVVYVDDPLNSTAWAHALSSVIHDEELSERLSTRGSRRAAGVTWETIAEEMVELARDVAWGRP